MRLDVHNVPCFNLIASVRREDRDIDWRRRYGRRDSGSGEKNIEYPQQENSKQGDPADNGKCTTSALRSWFSHNIDLH